MIINSSNNDITKAEVLKILEDFITVDLFNDYINGGFTMPCPIVDRLDVITHAHFDGTVSVKEPIANNHPATKKYVDDLFADIEIAEEGAY